VLPDFLKRQNEYVYKLQLDPWNFLAEHSNDFDGHVMKELLFLYIGVWTSVMRPENRRKLNPSVRSPAEMVLISDVLTCFKELIECAMLRANKQLCTVNLAYF
jgi:hypothetical protein